ncbi:hypothetical protein BsWGS_10657 [Bradybaena similaris]
MWVEKTSTISWEHYMWVEKTSTISWEHYMCCTTVLSAMTKPCIRSSYTDFSPDPVTMFHLCGDLQSSPFPSPGQDASSVGAAVSHLQRAMLGYNPVMICTCTDFRLGCSCFFHRLYIFHCHHKPIDQRECCRYFIATRLQPIDQREC